MNDISATTPETGAQDRAETKVAEAESRTVRRRALIRDLLLDALRGSKPYVKSYRAGRGAE